MSLRAAILGFLDLEPTSGYALRQRFDGSVGSFWSVTQSQIYRELHALEAGGKVRSRKVAGDGKPDSKVYALTDAGREELEAWLREPSEPVHLRHPLLLKLVFASRVPPAELDLVLGSYESAVSGTEKEYRRRLSAPEIFSLARSRREAELWKLSIEHGLAWCRVEAAWIRKARGRLSRPRPARKAPATGKKGARP